MISFKNQKEREQGKLQESVSKLENTIEKQNKIFDKIAQYQPDIKDSLAIIIECEKMGMHPELIHFLLDKKEICISGEIYSSQHFKNFKVESLKLSIEYDKIENRKTLKIEGMDSQKWMQEKHQVSLKFHTLENEEKIQKRLKR